MGLTSLQVCMDTSDWLQEAESSPGCCSMMDHSSSSSPSSAVAGDILVGPTSSLMEGGGRRLRPPHDQALKCPRCESTHTKFCYYNNYSLSQPRYFCKTCRRYWTKGGSLRNIPVGGGCRKSKKPSKKTNPNDGNALVNPHIYQSAPMPQPSSTFPHFNSVLGLLDRHDDNNNSANNNNSVIRFMEGRHGESSDNAGMMFPSGPHLTNKHIDFLDNKFDIMGINNGDFGVINTVNHELVPGINGATNYHGLCSPYGLLSLEVNNASSSFMDGSNCQRLMLPNYEQNNSSHSDHEQIGRLIDVKPNPKLLSLDWSQQEQAYNSNGGRDGNTSFGYINGLGSWGGMINGYGSSTRTNSLV